MTGFREGHKATAGAAAFALLFAVLTAAPAPSHAWEGVGPLVIEHTCTDLSRIPAAWVDSAQTKIKVHYGHTSHGMQIPEGLHIIDNALPALAYAYENNVLPVVPGALCIFNGQTSATYITPDLFWASEAGMNETRAVLNGNPSINISMFVFCQELETADTAFVDAYLDSMSVLEIEFPRVTFAYSTGNAQVTGANGYNRYMLNERIRAFCITNEKVLYDFADLDAWWYNTISGSWEHETYEYNGTDVPSEHPEWYGNDTAHTSYESCEQKGKAMWWLTTMLSGWYADPTGIEETSLGGLKKMFPGR